MYSVCVFTHKCRWSERLGVADPLEQKLQMVVVLLWCWEVKLGPLEEQHTVFTVEPSPQSHITFTFK